MKKHSYLLFVLFLTFTASYSQTMECEPNDTIIDVCVKYIDANGTYTGTFSSPDDVEEYWKIPKGSSGWLTITYSTPAASSLDMELYEITDSSSFSNQANFAGLTSLPGKDTIGYNLADNYLYYIYLPASSAADETWEFEVSGSVSFGDPFVGIKKFENNSGIKVYPTIVTEVVNVTFPSQINNAKINIYDVQGRLVKNERIIKSNTAISMSELNSGTYFLSVIEENEAVARFTVVKK